jgi:hypothetical protein
MARFVVGAYYVIPWNYPSELIGYFLSPRQVYDDSYGFRDGFGRDYRHRFLRLEQPQNVPRRRGITNDAALFRRFALEVLKEAF